jgi:nucleoside-diphosphate-sugar epimerase
VLVIGLSGQVGDALLPGLLQGHRRVLALSRYPRPDVAGVDWLTGSLEAMPALPAGVQTVLSLGPLDAFAAWLAAAADTTPDLRRVVALGSTGRADKRDSPDPGERDLARRLQAAEHLLFATGQQRGLAITLLRPTLIYGGGRDLTVSRLLAFGRRWGFVLLPRSATGLRQPVHVGDVAAAVLQCLEQPACAGHAFDLPGGETLAFIAMVRRVLARQAPGCRLLLLPTAWFRLALRVAARLRRAPFNAGMLARLHDDQLADAEPARLAFGYQPRRFEP